jgi:hypothetical protein
MDIGWPFIAGEILRGVLRSLIAVNKARSSPDSVAVMRGQMLGALKTMIAQHSSTMDEMTLETCVASSRRIIDELLPEQAEAAP